MATSDFYVQDNSDIEDKKLEAAKGLYQTGNYSGALRLYLDMVNTSYSYKLYYEIGRCYYKLNQFTDAESNFQRSIELDRHRNPSYVFLGNIYYKNGNVQKAIEYWTLSYSYRPDDEAVCLNLATSYFSKEMKFQSMFYYQKYLKYAKDKTSTAYLEIKKSIDEFTKMGTEFYQKAQAAVAMKDNQTAIQALEYAAKNFPIGFDINYLLGKLYYEEKDYRNALVYLKQAYCVDTKSLDIIQILASTMINLHDIKGAYCCFKRIIPLVMNNQKEYLEVIQTAKRMEESLGEVDCGVNLRMAEEYYNDNNYQLALFEYENCVILEPNRFGELDETIQRLKSFINPEERIIKSCFERGGASYSNGDYGQSNKYFTKIMVLAGENSSEYKFAKSRLVNV